MCMIIQFLLLFICISEEKNVKNINLVYYFNMQNFNFYFKLLLNWNWLFMKIIDLGIIYAS